MKQFRNFSISAETNNTIRDLKVYLFTTRLNIFKFPDFYLNFDRVLKFPDFSLTFDRILKLHDFSLIFDKILNFMTFP